MILRHCDSSIETRSDYSPELKCERGTDSRSDATGMIAVTDVIEVMEMMTEVIDMMNVTEW